jgi:hypothetical protein
VEGEGVGGGCFGLVAGKALVVIEGFAVELAFDNSVFSDPLGALADALTGTGDGFGAVRVTVVAAVENLVLVVASGVIFRGRGVVTLDDRFAIAARHFGKLIWGL